MKVVIVDDNASYAEALAEQNWNGGKAVRPAGSPSESIAEIPPREIAEEIADQIGGDDAVVLININLKCTGKVRQDQAGVEVLKYLRLTEDFDNQARKAHCVLYSFQDVERLLRKKPSSLIICSDGVSVIQLPHDFSRLDLRELNGERAQLENHGLDEFLRGEFTLPDERHSWANWWAARQMIKLYYLEKIHGSPTHPKVKLDKLPRPSGIQPSSPTYNKNKGTFSLTGVRERVSDPQVRNALYLFDQSAGLESEFSEADRTRLKDYRKALRESNLKIGIIDDEAQEISRNPGASIGWQTTYSHVLYDDERQVVDLLNSEQMNAQLDSSTSEALETLLKRIDNEFDFDPYACIFLDLRLLEDSTRPGDITKASGVKVLEEIRKAEPSLPVIMTTASNKLSTFFEITRTGADAYWVKQGVDERRTARESIENYVRLLELSSIVMGEKYQFFRRLGKAVKELKGKQDRHWWENHRWFDNDKGYHIDTNGRANLVFRLLNNSLVMLRSYLHQHEMGYGYKSSARGDDVLDQTTLWSIIQNLGKVLEEVHRWDQVRGRASGGIIGGHMHHGEFVIRRGDWFGFKLYDIRNDASHLESASNVGWDEFREFASSLICYLEYGDKDGFEQLRVENRGYVQSLEQMRNLYADSYGSRFREIYGA